MKKKPKPGDIRTIEKFLLFPKCFNKDRRWFSKEKILQIYTESGSMTFFDHYPKGWIEIGWNDQIKEVKIGEKRFNLFTCSIYSNIHIKYIHK
jgi:hypothetical protein